MNYRHAYHAGNFADVLKHTALVAVLRHLAKKDTPFVVIDTHAGKGLYDLAGMEAGKTGEAAEGIGRLLGATDLPAALQAYLGFLKFPDAGKYPGSPLLAAYHLRPTDRLVAIEKHDEEFAALKTALATFPRTRAVYGDGYADLKGLLPPIERRGLVLIDPPYEAENEFERLARAFADAYRRFATGIYLIWLPLKVRADADALAGEILNAGAKRLLLLTLDVGRAADALPGQLSACGLFVVNPPFGFADDMRAPLAAMASHLSQGPGASSRTEWLAGRE